MSQPLLGIHHCIICSHELLDLGNTLLQERGRARLMAIVRGAAATTFTFGMALLRDLGFLLEQRVTKKGKSIQLRVAVISVTRNRAIYTRRIGTRRLVGRPTKRRDKKSEGTRGVMGQNLYLWSTNFQEMHHLMRGS